MPSDDIADLLVERDVRSHPHKGARLRDFYYTWHKPSETVIKTVGVRIEELRSDGQNLVDAIETVAKEGLYRQRTSNKQFLPFSVIRSYYRRYQKEINL